jgi:hypothetical protein
MNINMLIRAAFAVLAIAAGIVPVANAGSPAKPDMTHHAGPYDNTGNGPQETGLEGGGG